MMHAAICVNNSQVVPRESERERHICTPTFQYKGKVCCNRERDACFVQLMQLRLLFTVTDHRLNGCVTLVPFAILNIYITATD